MSDCLIEKLTIEAPENLNSKGVQTDKYAILIYSNGYNCQRNTIKQCFIKSFGITLANPTTYVYGDGIGFDRQLYTNSICSDSAVKNNYVTLCRTNFFSKFGEKIIIQGNIFFGAKLLNMNLELCKYCEILGNQINSNDSSNGSHGLYPSGCLGLIIAGNIIHDNRKNGIKPRFATLDFNNIPDSCYSITGNICRHNGWNYEGDGIELQGLSQRMTIYGNVCVDNADDGIRLQNEGGSLVATNNLVVGNVAVLHSPPKGDDLPISNEGTGNLVANNIEEDFT